MSMKFSTRAQHSTKIPVKSDLLRSRQKVMQQRNQLRKYLQAVLVRNSLHY